MSSVRDDPKLFVADVVFFLSCCVYVDFVLFLFSFVVTYFSFLSCSFSIPGVQIGFYLPYSYRFFLLRFSSCCLINSYAFTIGVPFLLLLLLLYRLYYLYYWL